jgi:hypothetical protein
MRIKNFLISIFLLSSSTQLVSTQTLVYNKVSGSGQLTTTYTVDKTTDLYNIEVMVVKNGIFHVQVL